VRGGAIAAGNLTLRFCCELATLAALVLGGVHLVGGALGAGAGILAAVLVALMWARWIAPKAPRRLADPWRFALELAVFGAATATLGASGHRLGATLFAAVAVTTAALVRVWPEPVAT
jgi:predicted lysophospholipase L1 biosynthesis ABC-type transport system permease subunit